MPHILALLLLHEQEEDEQRFLRRQDLRSLRDAHNPFETADAQCEAAFRLPKDICRTLIAELQPFDTQQTSLPFGVSFFTALYFFANGSYQKCVGNNYVLPMSQSSVSRTLRYISGLIVQCKRTEISFPTTNARQLAIKERFYTKFGIKGVIGVIDCTHIPIICPPSDDPTKPCSLFMNRKGYYSLNTEAVCNDMLKFLFFCARFPGSVHDSGIWATSRVRSFLWSQRGRWLLGDQGYPLEPWLMVPLSTPVTRQELKYNKTHCKARNVIERSFGVLKSRFRCLSKHRTLQYSPETVGSFANACAILHNIMMDHFPETDVDVVEDESNGEVPPERASGNLNTEGERVRQSIIRTM